MLIGGKRVKRHRRHGRPSSQRVLLVAALAVVLYAGILLGIHAVGSRLEQSDVREPVGSLEGRFTSDDLILQAQGRTWTYRERDLTNILLIGTDWDEQRLEAADSRYAGQADFLMLVTLDQENKTTSFLQIDRDTLADIRIFGPFGDLAGTRRTQICLSYAFGDTPQTACENTVWSVSQLLGGIPIEGYFAMSMDGIVALNDALGGVTVTLEDDFSHLDAKMTKGATLTLQGKQAEYFVRGRMDVGEGTNRSRMKRQGAFISAALERIEEGMSGDMNFVSDVLDAVSDYVTTELERGWLINRAYESQGYETNDIRQIAGEHGVGEDGFVEFTVDQDALNDLLVSIFFE